MKERGERERERERKREKERERERKREELKFGGREMAMRYSTMVAT